MDELDLLTRHRPDPPPPTDAERASVRAALLAHIAGAEPIADPAAPTGPVVDLAASPRRTRRRLARAIALAGTAAAVAAAVVLVAGGSDRAPEPLRDRPATAAEQLQAVADVVAPYPDTPFVVRVRSVVRWIGPKGRTDTSEARVHHARPGVLVSETACETPCPALIFPGSEELPFPLDADSDAVRAGIDDTLRARTATDDPDEFLVQVRLSYLGGLLQHPAASPTARAEMMRMLAEVPGLTATPGVRSAFGDEGTLFRFTRSTGEETMLLIDPSDGYVLERRATAPAFDPDVVPEGREVEVLVGSPEGDYRSVTTYERPVAGPLPDAVETLAAVVAEKGPAAISGRITIPPGAPECIGQIGPTTGEDDGLGIPVPDGLAFTYCGLP